VRTAAAPQSLTLAASKLVDKLVSNRLNLTFFASVGPLGVGQKADVNGFLYHSGSSLFASSSVACCSASEDDDVSTTFSSRAILSASSRTLRIAISFSLCQTKASFSSNTVSKEPIFPG
jgi:hypothetical protein